MNDNTLEVKSLNTQFFTRVAEFESTTTSRRKRLVLSRLAFGGPPGFERSASARTAETGRAHCGTTGNILRYNHWAIVGLPSVPLPM